MTIEEIIAAIRRNQQQIQRAEERIASHKESIKEYEDTLLSLGVRLVPSASPDAGEPLTIEELKSKLWYLPSCTVEDYAAFIHNGVPMYSNNWEHAGPHTGCCFQGGDVTRTADWDTDRTSLPKIRRIGNQFYWESNQK